MQIRCGKRDMKLFMLDVINISVIGNGIFQMLNVDIVNSGTGKRMGKPYRAYGKNQQ